MSGGAENPIWVRGGGDEIFHLPFPYPWLLGNRSGAEFLEQSLVELAGRGVDIATDVAGVMLESFQGWGAVFYPPDYVSALAAHCRKNDIVLAFDEMQAGFARTGRKFGYQHYNIEPDLICCGKGMGSGYPLAGVIGLPELLDLPKIGTMSSTHSANPLACVAGLATIEEIESRDLVGAASAKGEVLSAAK